MFWFTLKTVFRFIIRVVGIAFAVSGIEDNVIADSYVFDYEKALRGLQKRKAMSDWFLASGYTGDYEGKQEYKKSIVVDELD